VGVSSLAFALSHAINVLGGADVADTALQILYALVFGVVAALTLIMVRSILPLIALHCANDFINFIGARQEVSPVDYLVVGIFVGACVLLVVVLRRDGSENARRTTGGSATSASSTVASQNSAVR
jgi:membrane protease YdiL (CAAX protease family)